ncbi:hypothetical protein BDN70DRAFT_899764 [Pholiota conissans]|uniref:Uncharacterized protein n=1 Tax=Pholiota conissans TaxID=109636 RepID=A0A9P6CUR5_9AGAR|nr:hypothetical protein BDN70DRAFT_899764 [Pholiota conissans]
MAINILQGRGHITQPDGEKRRGAMNDEQRTKNDEEENRSMTIMMFDTQRRYKPSRRALATMLTNIQLDNPAGVDVGWGGLGLRIEFRVSTMSRGTERRGEIRVDAASRFIDARDTVVDAFFHSRRLRRSSSLISLFSGPALVHDFFKLFDLCAASHTIWVLVILSSCAMLRTSSTSVCIDSDCILLQDFNTFFTE